MNMKLFITMTASIVAAAFICFVLHHLWSNRQQDELAAQKRPKGPLGFAPSEPAALPSQT